MLQDLDICFHTACEGLKMRGLTLMTDFRVKNSSETMEELYSLLLVT